MVLHQDAMSGSCWLIKEFLRACAREEGPIWEIGVHIMAFAYERRTFSC